jgi:hypothetical protein
MGSSDLVITDDLSGAAVPAQQQQQDGFDVAENHGGDMIRGKLVRFRGDYDRFFVGKGTATQLPSELTLLAHDMVTCWTGWRNGKPEHRVTRPGQRHPSRDELGDLDENQWEPGPDGRPADPWKDSRYIYLINPSTLEQLTLVLDSYGGRRAAGELKDMIRNVRGVRPGALPMVRLGSEDMPTKFGIKRKPRFVVVDWRQTGPGARPQLAARPQQATIEGSRSVEPKHPAFDDEVPPIEEIPF